MSTQNEGKGNEQGDDRQGMPDDTGKAGRASGIGSEQGPVGGRGSQQSGEQASQQGAMPPSQTDDDQYDQGTVKRAP